MHVDEIRWKNFRAFRDTGWLELRPITLIIGPNNTGKSSVLAPLLILRQTLSSGRADSPLVIRGTLINAGSFSDLVHRHILSSEVSFDFRFQITATKPTKQGIGVNPPAVCEVSFGSGSYSTDVNLERYSVEDAFGRSLLLRNRWDNGGYSLEKIRTWAKDATEGMVSGNDESDRAARRAIRDSRPNHFLFESDKVLDKALDALKSGRRQSESIRDIQPLRLSSFVTRYCSAVDIVQHFVATFLRNVVYLGPMREQPRRFYQASGDVPQRVGARGQFSPEILLRASETDASLTDNVNRWLQRFGMPGRLECEHITDTMFSLVLKQNNEERQEEGSIITNYADMGFGFSQILPLIVEGLTASDDTLLVTEQPEIHLNPRLQALLGDFFVEVADRGVSVLAETHSEHLLLSIRRLIAEGKLNAEHVAVYYTERQDGFSSIRPVPIRADGHIEDNDWPEGFFEDSLRESFALATAQARSRRAT
jgi:predicted ATPase